MKLENLKTLNLLYIEDDESIAQNYILSFELFFNKIYLAKNDKEALDLFNTQKIDMILVDIELKNSLNGLEIVKEIRKNNIEIPIVFLTSHSDNEYLLKAVNLQIDGYIIKPLDIVNFQQTMLNCLKKLKPQKIIYLDKNLYYDLDSLELFKDNQKIPLGKKENTLLQLFLNNKNKILSRSDLEYYVWNEDIVSDSAIKNLILSLRKKIGKDKIINISKLGWKIDLS